MLFNVAYPVLYVVETLFICDIIYQHDTHGSSVVGSGDCAEAFLPGSVPNKMFNFYLI